MSNHSLLTLKEAAVLLSLKISRLRTAIFRREIPHVKVGRLVRFDMNDLLAWLENQKVKPTSKGQK